MPRRLNPLPRAWQAWQSSSFRLALCFGLLVLGILAGTFTVYYVEMVGTASQQLDDYALRTSKRLLHTHSQQGDAGLQAEITQLLGDGIDSQTEVLIFQNRQGHVWAGNAVAQMAQVRTSPGLQDVMLEQEARHFMGRVQVHDLGHDRFLLAGSDLQPLTDIRDRYFKATGIALALVMALSLAAAVAFRYLMDQRAGALRRAMRQAGQGNLHFRLPKSRRSDEFSLLEQDINTMLEQLEQLVHGIRHVSNMVAHNLRTPLNRTLHHVQAAMQAPEAQRQEQLEQAQEELQQLSRLFAKMLLLAEVESGVGQQRFEPLNLRCVLQEVLEFYAPIFEDRQVQLQTQMQDDAWVLGDSHLLANALSNVLDNFLKYGGDGTCFALEVNLQVSTRHITLQLRDHGHGVPADALARMGQHFFRACTHQQLAGHGIGLASVRAIARLHQGSITWHLARPGLATTLRLPRVSAPESTHQK